MKYINFTVEKTGTGLAHIMKKMVKFWQQQQERTFLN